MSEASEQKQHSAQKAWSRLITQCAEPVPVGDLLAHHTASGVALLLIDVINDLDFEGGAELAKAAEQLAQKLLDLKEAARAQGMPIIYLNDNHGLWRSDINSVIAYCMREDAPGRHITARLLPDPDDYVVLKPQQSGFFQTPLETLLTRLRVHTVVLGGMAGNMCVLLTAHGAHERQLRVVVPRDCILSRSGEESRYALRHLQLAIQANTAPLAHLALDELRQPPKAG